MRRYAYAMKFRELQAILAEAAQKHVSPNEADYFAVEILETHVRKSPRTDVVEEAVKDLEACAKHGGDVERRVLPGFIRMDFHGRGPSLQLKEIHDTLATKADTNGIAMASILNSAGMHTMHLWTQGLAKRGYFAIAGFNGGPEGVIPLNGTHGILGTNPITFGFPGDKGDIVIDMATSEIPYFQIVAAKKEGKMLPPNSAVDSVGELTTDPKLALDDTGASNLTPLGNTYKGYNLNYVMEIMTSALIGAKISTQMDPRYVAEEHGGFVIAISIDAIADRKSYDESIADMNAKIRTQKPRADVDKLTVPGDRNLEHKATMGDDMDVNVETALLERLRTLTG